MKTHQGMLTSSNLKYAIIASRFNELITTKLIQGAEDTLLRHGAKETEIEIFWVPGAYEIPLIAKKIANLNKYDAIIALGAIIRGATPHFDMVANEVSKGVANVGLETNTPIIFGILTTDDIEQALERAGTKAGNKGADAAMSAIEMANLINTIK